MRLTNRNRLFAAAVLCVGLTGLAQAAPPLEKTQGDVRYVSGGIGIDESTQMKAMASQYSLSLTFAEQDAGKADYLANIPVTITDAQGRTVLSVNTDGPYLLVQLPPGSYSVTASHGGAPKTNRVTVGQGHGDRVVFDWR